MMSPFDFLPSWISGTIRLQYSSFSNHLMKFMCGILSKLERMNKVAILITMEKNHARNPWNKGNTSTYEVKNPREDVSVQKNHNFSWWGTLKPENILKVQCLCEKFTILLDKEAEGGPHPKPLLLLPLIYYRNVVYLHQDIYVFPSKFVPLSVQGHSCASSKKYSV